MFVFAVTQCPNPASLQTDEIILTESFTADVNFTTTIRSVSSEGIPVVSSDLPRWKCKDRRFLIKLRGSSVPGVTRLEAECLWYRNYSVVPADLECVLAYCDNPVSLPNNNGANYNLSWDGALLTNLSHSLFYPCQDNHRLEDDT